MYPEDSLKIEIDNLYALERKVKAGAYPLNQVLIKIIENCEAGVAIVSKNKDPLDNLSLFATKLFSIMGYLENLKSIQANDLKNAYKKLDLLNSLSLLSSSFLSCKGYVKEDKELGRFIHYLTSLLNVSHDFVLSIKNEPENKASRNQFNVVTTVKDNSPIEKKASDISAIL